MSRTAVSVFRLAAAAALVLGLVGSSFALQRPTRGQLEQYRRDGTLRGRVTEAKRLGNHRTRSDLAVHARDKLRRLYERTTGDTTQEGGSFAPPPALRGMPTTGTVKVLCLLIAFPNYPPTTSTATVADRLFGAGDVANYPYESLRSYYQRSSYNQLDITGNVLGWYTTAYNRETVPQTDTGRQNLIKEALGYHNGQGHDFSQYDNDGDGSIDYLIVVWTGPDTGWSGFWWGYQTTFLDWSYRLDGKRLDTYSWQWEANPHPGNFRPKVTIHETGHALGLPDYYDYDDTVGPRGGVGGLDMMDNNWGDHNAFSKFVLGWISPTTYAAGTAAVTLGASGSAPEALIVMPNATPGDPFGEYFVVQNRHRVNNDKGYPADGAVIWHVDASLNSGGTNFLYDNSYTAHKLLRLMEADGLEEIQAGFLADAPDYYAAGATFGPATLPNSNRYDGTASGLTVRNFSAAGPAMTLTFDLPGSAAGAPSAPVVPASNSTGSYAVTWGPSSTGGASYELQEATDTAFTGGLRTAYSGAGLGASITGRTSGATYYYRVQAAAAGYTASAWISGANGCSVLFTAAAPGVPSVPSASATGSYAVSWTASATPGVTYELQEAADAGFTAGLRTAYSGTGLSAPVADRASGTTYYYRVRASVSGYTPSAWVPGANGCGVRFTAGTPGAASVPATSSTGSYTVSWTASATPGATYELQEATDAAFTAGLRTAYSGAALSTSISGRASGTAYYYRVRATLEDYEPSAWAPGGNGCAVLLTAAAPPALAVPATSDTGAYSASWGASATPGASYELQEATDSGFTAAVRTAYSGTGLSASITGRATGTTYYYRVRAAKTAYSPSAWVGGTNGCAVTLAAGAPSAPVVPATSDTGGYGISWGASATPGASYELQEATHPAFLSGVRVVYTGSGVAASVAGRSTGSTYYYRVRAAAPAYNPSGWVSGANGCAVTIPAAPPSSLAVPATSATGTFALTWGASATPGATYQLDEARDSGFTVALQTVYSGASLGTTLAGRASGVSYHYRVRALASGYSVSQWAVGGNGCVVTLPASPPSSLSVPSGSTTGSYAVTWDPSITSGATYELQEAVTPTFGAGLRTAYTGSGTSASVSGRATATTYYYRVRAAPPGYNPSAWVSGANGCAVTLPATAPLVVSVPATSTTPGFTVTWLLSGTPGATYEIQEAKDPGFSTGLRTLTASTGSVSIAGRQGGMTYYYRVRALATGYGPSRWTAGPNGCAVANQPPLLAPVASKAVAEGSSLSFTVSASDPDGTTPAVTASSLPDGASFAGTTFAWTPRFDQAGAYDVTFTASDGALFASEVVRITVNDVKYTVSVSPSVPGSGNVGGGGVYEPGSAVTLTATAALDWRFAAWSGDASGNANPLTLTVSSNKKITATFVQITAYTVSASASPAEGGTVTGGGVYAGGTTATLAAAPSPGYRFAAWSGDASGAANPLSLLVLGNKSVTASFVRVYAITAAARPVEGGGVTGAGEYEAGAIAALTATAATGYRFAGWSGDAAGASNPLALTADRSKVVTADFVRVYSLTALASPGSGGTVEGGGIYDSGAQLTLKATAGSGYRFAGWSGDGAGSANPLTLTADRNKTVTATFVRVHTVATASSPEAGGTVSGGGYYDPGASATLTPSPAAGYRFTGWSGDAAGAANPLAVTVNRDLSVTAQFLRLCTVTAGSNPSAGGTVTGAGSYDPGATAQLTAEAAAGYRFTGWAGDATGTTNPVSIAMEGDKNVSANFVRVYRIAANANPAAGGSVSGGGGFDGGTTATLTAAPAPGYRFAGWSGDASGAVNPLALSIDGDKEVTAHFVRVFSVVVSGSPQEGGTVSGSGLYDAGAVATLTATAFSGYRFAGWSGDLSGASSSLKITVGGDTKLTALFQANRAPVLDRIGSKQVGEGETLQFSVQGSDPDGDALAFRASNLPTGATFDPATGAFAWSPGLGLEGNYPVTFVVTDSAKPPLSASETVTITVGHVNRPPVLDPIGPQVAAESTLLSFQAPGYDPEGGPVTWTAANLPPGATFDPTTARFSWTPGTDQAGNYAITFAATDSGSPALTASEVVTITVGDVNRPPVLDPIGSQQALEGAVLKFSVTAGDPDGGALTFGAGGLPRGAVLDSSAQLFEWAPSFSQAGVYRLTFVVTDGGTPPLSDAEEVTITVGDTNRPPLLARIGPQSVLEGETLAFVVAASDPDGDPLAFSADGLPMGASFDPQTRAFRWSPLFHQAGVYRITFAVADGGTPPLSASEGITITAGHVNRPPVLGAIGNRTASQGEILTFAVTATDPDGDSLSYGADQLPAGASFDSQTQLFRWVPSPNQTGNFKVVFTAGDAGTPSLSDSKEVLIAVAPAPSAGGETDSGPGEVTGATGTTAAARSEGDGGGGGGCFIATASKGAVGFASHVCLLILAGAAVVIPSSLCRVRLQHRRALRRSGSRSAGRRV